MLWNHLLLRAHSLRLYASADLVDGDGVLIMLLGGYLHSVAPARGAFCRDCSGEFI